MIETEPYFEGVTETGHERKMLYSSANRLRLTPNRKRGYRRTCLAIPLARLTYKYHSKAPQYTPSRQHIPDLALSRTGWRYRLSKLGQGITTQRLVRVAEISISALARGKHPPTPEKEAAAH